MIRGKMFELSFPCAKLEDNYASVDLTAVFTYVGAAQAEDAAKADEASGAAEAAQAEALSASPVVTVTVKGFYAGDGCCKVRFLPEKAGLWRWKVSGIAEGEGEEFCEESGARGKIRAEGTHFVDANGAFFYPFGTTVYGMINQDEEQIDTTFKTLAAAPFNKVRFCVFPKHYNYNHNEPQFYAFEMNEGYEKPSYKEPEPGLSETSGSGVKGDPGRWNVNRPSFAYWEHFERRLAELEEMGIEADIILFHPYDRWGFSQMTQQDNLTYLDYLLRRISAFPNVWWSLANEYDLNLTYKTVEDWEEIEEFVAANDPYHHLLSNHNCFRPWDYSRPNVTHVSIQTKRLAEVGLWQEQYGKPVVVDECCYEGNIAEFWGSISGEEMTARFWRVVTSGGYCTHGETFYDDHDVLWWAKGGVLKGKSPERIAWLRSFAESLPGPVEPLDDGFGKMIRLSDEELDAMMDQVPEDFKVFLMAIRRTPRQDRMIQGFIEHEWRGHVGEDVYIAYLENRPVAKAAMDLPEGHTYRVEILDTWEMTRETVLTGVSGHTVVPMPGKPWMAAVAFRED